MKSLIISGNISQAINKKPKLKRREFSFFYAGARRSRNGYMDAWDAPLLFGMLLNGYKAILPPRNLINNVGNDDVAVHTSKKSRWVNLEPESIQSQNEVPRESNMIDRWLITNYFKIRFRHVLSTRITWFFDLMRKPKYEKLAIRISNARIGN